MRARWGLPVLPILAISLPAGCSGPERTGAATVAAAPPLTVAEEQLLGARLESRIGPARRLQDAGVVAYVRGLGQVVAEQATETPPEIVFRFDVLDEPELVDGFALPGGHVYLTSGLIAGLEDEAELVAALAHLVAHVAERHAVEEMTASYGAAALRMAAEGRDGGLPIQLSETIARRGALLTHEAASEREADTLGLQYVLAAGYDPHAYRRLFLHLEDLRREALRGGRDEGGFLATHPAPEGRLVSLERRLERLGQVPDRVERERYRARTVALREEPHEPARSVEAGSARRPGE